MTMRNRRNEADNNFLMAVLIILLFGIFAISTCAKATVVEMIKAEARRQHFDPDIAVAVATVESNLDQNVVGDKGEIGVFQILPRVYPGANLRNLKTNIRLGIEHLKYWQRVCPTIEGISFVNCYNAGFRRPKYPFLRPYVRKVAAIMRRQ
jgi:soluble lytic murein transglycosylase-like protein